MSDEKQLRREEWEKMPHVPVFAIAPSEGFWAAGSSVEEVVAKLRKMGCPKRTPVKIWTFDDRIRGAHFDGMTCGYNLDPDLPRTPEEWAKHRNRLEIKL